MVDSIRRPSIRINMLLQQRISYVQRNRVYSVNFIKSLESIKEDLTIAKSVIDQIKYQYKPAFWQFWKSNGNYKLLELCSKSYEKMIHIIYVMTSEALVKQASTNINDIDKTTLATIADSLANVNKTLVERIHD